MTDRSSGHAKNARANDESDAWRKLSTNPETESLPLTANKIEEATLRNSDGVPPKNTLICSENDDWDNFPCNPESELQPLNHLNFFKSQKDPVKAANSRIIYPHGSNKMFDRHVRVVYDLAENSENNEETISEYIKHNSVQEFNISTEELSTEAQKSQEVDEEIKDVAKMFEGYKKLHETGKIIEELNEWDENPTRTCERNIGRYNKSSLQVVMSIKFQQMLDKMEERNPKLAELYRSEPT